MQESIWRSSFRYFLASFFGFLGILLAFILIIWVVSEVETSDDSLSTNYGPEILPNAEGLRKKLSKDAPVILQVEIEGVIGIQDLTQKEVENLLVESREETLKNNRVKGILLHINSPGGTLNDADGIYRALQAYKLQYKVPIIAFVDGICASGGMYIACAADEIYATDASVIGSIGVLTSPFINVSNLMEKVGVQALTISAGKGKDDLDPLRPWKKGEEKNIEEVIKYYYTQFVNLVIKSRPKVNPEALVSEYGAKIFPAAQATEIGLIDGVSNSREEVLKKLLVKLGIEDHYYQVVYMENTNWLNQLLKTDSPLISGKLKHEIKLNGELSSKLSNQPLLLYR